MNTHCDVALLCVAAVSLCQMVNPQIVVCFMACLLASTSSEACHALARQMSGP